MHDTLSKKYSLEGDMQACVIMSNLAIIKGSTTQTKRKACKDIQEITKEYEEYKEKVKKNLES